MSDEGDYRVVFNGVPTGEYDLPTTKARFTKAFKLDTKRTECLFTGKDYVIETGISEQTAMEYAIKLAEIGCECYFERVVDAVGDNHSHDPDFVERRKSIRRLRYRRDPRPGAVVPDRRKVPSRRDIDLKLLERDGDFPGNTVPKGV